MRDSGADDRWAKVEMSANGITDYGIAQALRTYYLIYLPLGAVFLVSVGAFLSIVIFGLGPDEWPAYLGFGISIATVGAFIGGLIYAWKRVNPLVRPKRQGALIWLDKSERKGVRDQIFGRVPPVRERLSAVRGIVVQIRQSLALMLLLAPGTVLLCIGQMLLATRSRLSGFQWLWIPLAAVFLVVLVTAVWQFKRTGRFLEQTATPENPAP